MNCFPAVKAANQILAEKWAHPGPNPCSTNIATSGLCGKASMVQMQVKFPQPFQICPDSKLIQYSRSLDLNCLSTGGCNIPAQYCDPLFGSRPTRLFLKGLHSVQWLISGRGAAGQVKVGTRKGQSRRLEGGSSVCNTAIFGLM